MTAGAHITGMTVCLRSLPITHELVGMVISNMCCVSFGIGPGGFALSI